MKNIKIVIPVLILLFSEVQAQIKHGGITNEQLCQYINEYIVAQKQIQKVDSFKEVISVSFYLAENEHYEFLISSLINRSDIEDIKPNGYFKCQDYFVLLTERTVRVNLLNMSVNKIDSIFIAHYNELYPKNILRTGTKFYHIITINNGKVKAEKLTEFDLPEKYQKSEKLETVEFNKHNVQILPRDSVEKELPEAFRKEDTKKD